MQYGGGVALAFDPVNMLVDRRNRLSAKSCTIDNYGFLRSLQHIAELKLALAKRCVMVTTLKWATAIMLTVIAMVIVASILGISVQFLSWSLGWAALGDDATAKWVVLFWWTFGALFVGAVAKIVVLVRNRNRHALRLIEYPCHAITAGLVTGGLAYGTVSLVVAAFGDSLGELKPLVDANQDDLIQVAYMAVLPIVILMMSAVLTAARQIESIPRSRPPDTTIPQIVDDIRTVARRVKRGAASRRIQRWWTRDRDD